MRLLGSLKSQVMAWSAGVSLVLYLAASALVLGIDSRGDRRDLEVMLYAQAEALASYHASSGRLDYPELRHKDDSTPLVVFLRVVEGGRVLAATPGIPDLPIARPTEAQYGRLRIVRGPAGPSFAVVRHDVWNHPDRFVEAVSGMDAPTEHRRNLELALALAGIALVPMAGLGGKVVAGRALRPLDKLVASIRALDSHRLEDRLVAPGAASEIQQLADEFNSLLARVEESFVAMHRFTVDASHELRTPISILRTGLEVTLRRERSPEEYKATMRENLAEIKRVQRVVEGLLVLARPQPGQTDKLPLVAVDVSAVVANVIAAVEPVARERQIAVTSEIEPAVEVSGDRDRLRLVVLNLVDNALKFTPRGKSVQVRLGAEGGRARLLVRDEGPGISADDRDRIFDRYFRGASRRPSAPATGGIGLSVVQWVVESHGGTVSLLRTGDTGSTFEVVLPLVDERPGEEGSREGRRGDAQAV